MRSHVVPILDSSFFHPFSSYHHNFFIRFPWHHQVQGALIDSDFSPSLSLARALPRALPFPYPSSMVTLASSDFKPSQALYHGIKDQSFTDFISYVFEEADPKSVPHFKSKGLSPIPSCFLPSLKFVVPIILQFLNQNLPNFSGCWPSFAVLIFLNFIITDIYLN